jgi:hypothetical protein
MLQNLEKVLVLRSQHQPHRVGQHGIVLGISYDEATVYEYGVYFEDSSEAETFYPEELQGTGELVDRSYFYEDGDVLRVRVQGGRGSIVDDT